MLEYQPVSAYRFERQSRIAIFALQAAVIAYFLIYMQKLTFLGPPLDDSWIHYQYAKNMAERSEISFNPGHWSTGTTSLLWDLSLTAGAKTGLPVMPLSLALGVILFFIIGQQVYSIFKTYWAKESGAILSLLVVIFTGNLAWFALSGMETLLFICLGLCWINCFQNQRWGWSGLLAGALMLTRIEGMIFFLLGIFFTLKRWGFNKLSLKALTWQLGCGIPVTLPSFILNQVVTGHFYPTTMAGKKWLYGMEPGLINLSFTHFKRFFLSWAATLYQTNWWPQMIDRPSTLTIAAANWLFPGKVIKESAEFAVAPYPMWFQAVAIIIGGLMLLILLRGFYRLSRQIINSFFRRKEVKSWELLFYCFLAQNLIYLILMPHRGHGGRYQAVNFLLFGLFILAGTETACALKKWKRILSNCLLKPVVILVYFFSLITWADIYANSVKQVNIEHRAAGEWLKENIPPKTLVAAFDVGAVKYFSQLPVLDIAGLTDGFALKAALAADMVPLMKQRGAEYLVMIEESTPYREGYGEKIIPRYSVFYRKLGIEQQIGNSLNLIPLKRFEMPNEKWYRTWLALRTHSPVIVVYKIVWL